MSTWADERVDPAIVVDPPARKRRVPRRAKRPSRAAAIAAASLVGLAGLALWFLFFSLVLTSLQQHGSQARLYARLREELANATAPLGGYITNGSPVALLDAHIPGMESLVVVEGTSSGDLMLGPGHRRDTPLPGQRGTSVIFGRSVTYGAPFRSLSHLAVGDRIDVTTGQGRFAFRVEDLRGPGDPLPPPVGSDGSRLTMVTAASSGWRSGWAPDHAMYVDASLIDADPVPAPAGRPTTILPNEHAMAGDGSARTLALFWLQEVVLVGAAFIWARRRWGPWQTWIAGVPLALGVLWGAAGAGLRLWPNLI